MSADRVFQELVQALLRYRRTLESGEPDLSWLRDQIIALYRQLERLEPHNRWDAIAKYYEEKEDWQPQYLSRARS